MGEGSYGGSLGAEPKRPLGSEGEVFLKSSKARRMCEKSPRRWKILFCNFSIKITHFYAYFGQNNYFKAITYQLKAFETSPQLKIFL